MVLASVIGTVIGMVIINMRRGGVEGNATSSFFQEHTEKEKGDMSEMMNDFSATGVRIVYALTPLSYAATIITYGLTGESDVIRLE